MLPPKRNNTKTLGRQHAHKLGTSKALCTQHINKKKWFAHKTKISPTPDILHTELISFTISFSFCYIINWFVQSWLLVLMVSSYGKVNSSVVKKYENTIAKEAKRSERGRLPGVLLPLGMRRRGRARRGRSLQMLARFGRRRTACTAAAERQRQPVDAADTPPRHHSPSVVYTRLPAPNSPLIHSSINQCVQTNILTYQWWMMEQTSQFN